MKSAIIVIIFCFGFWELYSQDTLPTDQIQQLKLLISRIEAEQNKVLNKIEIIESTIPELNSSVGSLTLKLDSTDQVVNTTSRELKDKIELSGEESSNRISSLDQQLSLRTKWGSIGFLLALLLTATLFFIFRMRAVKDKTAVEAQIMKTKIAIEEEQIQVNTKLAELYNGQMELLKAERQNKSSDVKAEVDHSLALKVADEITKMQMYLSRMDSKVRGFASLNIAVNNVVDNIKANGYDIIDHFNKPFNEGMNMDATMELDPSLQAGVQIIKRVIKPEVHFNNKLIQRAQVIVAFND